jgi:uncharacterized protein YceK
MKIIQTIICLALFITISGCASIAGNNTRKVAVKSYPSGARIYVDNMQYGVTPATITLPSYIYGGKSVQVRKAGYEDQAIMVNTKFQPIGLFNIIFWPGFIVDAATGSIVKIDPSDLNLEYKLQKA